MNLLVVVVLPPLLLDFDVSGVFERSTSGVLRPSWGENLGIKLFFSFWLGVDDRVRGDGALLLPKN